MSTNSSAAVPYTIQEVSGRGKSLATLGARLIFIIVRAYRNCECSGLGKVTVREAHNPGSVLF